MPRAKPKPLTHLDQKGRARMVDVSTKKSSIREAVAEAVVSMSSATLHQVVEGGLEKGDAIAVARVAGIMAAKRTHELIPLCHPIALSNIDVTIESAKTGLRIVTTARTTDRTGVEMEALVAASVAALTVYDMVKGVDRAVTVKSVRLLSKSGGRSGSWKR